MSLTVIGAGVGRTGTYSLKLALERLGLGPCHHMEEVLNDAPRHVPTWAAAADGEPDWRRAYDGYRSAVDWPTASFWSELAAAYPEAKLVLTVRSTESWVQSFSQTIQKLLAGRDAMPPHMLPWLDMATAVLGRAGFTTDLDEAALARAFEAHAAAVREAVPAERLLVYEVKQGWEPLCAFLGQPVPDEPFPRSNDRGEFWDRVRGAQ